MNIAHLGMKISMIDHGQRYKVVCETLSEGSCSIGYVSIAVSSLNYAELCTHFTEYHTHCSCSAKPTSSCYGLPP